MAPAKPEVNNDKKFWYLIIQQQCFAVAQPMLLHWEAEYSHLPFNISGAIQYGEPTIVILYLLFLEKGGERGGAGGGKWTLW